jgi:hypothetical protein
MDDTITAQFLRHLRTLTGPSVPLDFVRNLRTNRLLSNIQALSATHLQAAVDDVAQVVEKIKGSHASFFFRW